MKISEREQKEKVWFGHNKRLGPALIGAGQIQVGIKGSTVRLKDEKKECHILTDTLTDSMPLTNIYVSFLPTPPPFPSDHFYYVVKLAWNSLWSPGWPQTRNSPASSASKVLDYIPVPLRLAYLPKVPSRWLMLIMTRTSVYKSQIS